MNICMQLVQRTWTVIQGSWVIVTVAHVHNIWMSALRQGNNIKGHENSFIAVNIVHDNIFW